MKFLLVACLAVFAVASGTVAPVSQWSLQELDAAIQDPSTDPLLLPYLEDALNDMMTALWSGVDQTVATVVLPATVVEAINTPVVEQIVAPAPVAQSGSPLVQIILNINAKAADATPAVVAPGAAAEPIPVMPENIDVVQVVDTVVQPEVVGVAVLPETVGVAILPETVGVAVLPETVGVAVLPETVGVAVLPETVAVATPINPIDAVAIEGVVAVNPIDNVAIESIDVNPIDVMAPVIPVVGASGAIGGILV